MIEYVDVTYRVRFGDNDSDSLPLDRCVCGKNFESWDFILHEDKDDPKICPSCGRKLFFQHSIRVYEIAEVEE